MKQYIITLFIFTGFVARAASGVNVSFVAPISTIGVGQSIVVQARLDTGRKEINAIEGDILFPETIITLLDIRDDSSLINFWIQKPTIKGNHVTFSGIVPGGYNGKDRVLVSFIFTGKTTGKGDIAVNAMTVLSNDGKATPINVSSSPLILTVAASSSAGIMLPHDTEPPEAFTPIITHSPLIMDDRYVAVFAAQDKGSGIDHYEISEIPRGIFPRNPGMWSTAESPYLLNDQSRSSDVYIKAVDRAGNTRLVKITGYSFSLWACIKDICMLVVLLLMGWFFCKRYWVRHRR